MKPSGPALLNSLKSVEWDIAARTYGNSHATLIGLLVKWWLGLEPVTHCVVESGPSHGHHKKGVGGGRCDALFCVNSDAVGVLEVEGTRIPGTITKIGCFLASAMDDLQKLEFAVVLLYPSDPRGRGPKRGFQSWQTKKWLSAVADISREHPNKAVILVTVEKDYEHGADGVRRRNDYYKGSLRSVDGFVYKGGEEIARSVLWSQQ